MRYGPSLNPKWIVAAVWRRRRLIFYAVSALSLATNAVVLAESLEVGGTLTSLLHQLLPQLREVGVLLVQRPVLVLLLNLIMLRMLVTSGLLGGGLNQHEGREIQAASMGGRADKRVPISHLLDDPAEAHDHDLSLFRSVFKKRRSSALLFGNTEPGGAVLSASSSSEQAHAGKNINRGVRQASLFTIEPLDSNIEPPSMVLDTTQSDMGTARSDMRDGGGFIDDPQGEVASFAPNLDRTPGHFNNRGRPDDYDLDRQEFNERVETFITKFKRNLTMQRQDSFNRLLSLVGGGGMKR